MDNNGIMEKIKELVREGNASRVIIRDRAGKEVLNMSLNMGVLGGVVALSASKWVLLAGVLATVGFGCTVEVIKQDGNVVNVYNEQTADKAKQAAAKVRDVAADAVEKLNLSEVVNNVSESVDTLKDKLKNESVADLVDDVKGKLSFDDVVDASVEESAKEEESEDKDE